MKTWAVIGVGKTGGEILHLLHANETALTFNQSRPVTAAALQAADAAIIFVPGHAVPALLSPVLEAGIPTVWGSTGFTWPTNLAAQLIEKNARWVVASNFSPMMVLIQKMLEMLGETAPQVLEDAEYTLHEVHHLHKKDQPSGTALSWQEWLGVPCDISATREGDVKGIHTLTINTATETLKLHHEVHDRRVFAAGALKAARYLLAHPELNPGLYRFCDLFNERKS